jgi:hypothetical protein
VIRAAILALVFAAACPAWVESVEFPWNACPRQLWERELVWLKNIGVMHVSLPPARDPAQLDDVIRIIRRLDLEADLEGPVPEALRPLTRAHGGPLTEPLPGPPIRVSALAPAALAHSRDLLASGARTLLWTDLEETLDANGFHPGAVSFAGEEKPAALAVRREAQLSVYWGKSFSSLHETPGASVKIAPGAAPAAGIAVRQFVAENGVSLVSVANKSAQAWTGDLRILYPAAKRAIGLPAVSVPAHDDLWIPVNVPLTASPLCKDCSAFAGMDHLVYATAELTAVEYENGILAMEFFAPSAGEAILQLSHEPSGPFMAGGRPTAFDWDDHTRHLRLKIPAGSDASKHVRIGIAIQPPDATGFFDSARVLLIGETNRLTAQFLSEAIARRSRLLIAPAFAVEQEAGENELALIYRIAVPEAAVHGDHAELAVEADGMRMSHAHPELLRAVTLRFPDAIDVHPGAAAALPLFPATVPVNRRAGRDITVAVRNNAPKIRTFHIEIKAEGLEFLPATMDVAVGASVARDVSFRVFANEASPGLHAGMLVLSGAAAATEAVQFVVIPQNGAVAFPVNGFSLIESGKSRASFMPGRWLEFVDKENNRNLLPGGGMPFTPGPIIADNDALIFAAGQRTIRLADLEQLVPKPVK